MYFQWLAIYNTFKQLQCDNSYTNINANSYVLAVSRVSIDSCITILNISHHKLMLRCFANSQPANGHACTHYSQLVSYRTLFMFHI